MIVSDIQTNPLTPDAIVEAVNIPEGVQRNVWYAITVTDEFGNHYSEAWDSSGKNAAQVSEDATEPVASITILDNDDIEVQGTLVKGSYLSLIHI